MSNTSFVCFDTEDNSRELMEAGLSGFNKRVTQIAAITDDGAHYYNKGNVPKFLEWVLRQPQRFFYSHNQQYDLGNLFADYLDHIDVTLVSGRVIKAVWGKKVFVDTFNIWPMAVKKIGEAFGLEKLETERMSTDKAYVFRDVEIIRQAMLFVKKFCEDNGIDGLPSTLGGLCVKAWKVWGGENVPDSSELSREAFYGGRVELFKTRNESRNVCYTDINSLYPAVMRGRFPATMEDTGTTLKDFGIARAVVKVPKTELPVLPVRRDDARILYPWGTLTGVWTVAELRYAERQGARIIKVIEAMGTNESIVPYGTFVTKLYKARQASQSSAEKLFYKLLMNNLYGRLGSRGTIGRSVWQNERNCNDGVPYGQKVLVNYQMPLAEETNWAHAAYVTSYGRMALHSFMATIGSAAMIYCDTDSTIFDCARRRIPFEVGAELGQMKLESWETDCVTYAPKLYRIGKKYRSKGVPVRLAKEFIDTGRAEFDLPFKMREAIAFYDRGNTRKLSVWRKVIKQRRNEYDKKTLHGNRYLPCNVRMTC